MRTTLFHRQHEHSQRLRSFRFKIEGRRRVRKDDDLARSVRGSQMQMLHTHLTLGALCYWYRKHLGEKRNGVVGINKGSKLTTPLTLEYTHDTLTGWLTSFS